MSCPGLCLGAASGADQDEPRAIAAAIGATSKYRKLIEQLLCLTLGSMGRCS